ncbi:tyrosine-type recombinase/integrase [Rosenbergiella epipactidis]|uniref:tyrosine-type recombinase/integrase n=1 Tax=Rosenbergiella epipactidis TaxID=1544694 RepID=UPI003BAB857B
MKTAQSIRQIPVSEPVAKLVQTYVKNYRGGPGHPYLLNSQKNQPLSTKSITKLFAKLSASLSDTARAQLRDWTSKESVTTHDLRHTFTVVRLNLIRLNMQRFV